MKRKKGEWIIDYYYDPGYEDEVEVCTCSICGKEGYWDYKYCPYCGADMKGKEKINECNH